MNEEIEEEKEEEEEKLSFLLTSEDFWKNLNEWNTPNVIHKVFVNLGYDAELIPPSNDEGIDLILNGEIAVQIKNQKKKVNRPDLKKFWGSWKDSHKKGIFVSINGFTDACEKFVKDKPILLYDVNEMIGMSEGEEPEWYK